MDGWIENRSTCMDGAGGVYVYIWLFVVFWQNNIV